MAAQHIHFAPVPEKAGTEVPAKHFEKRMGDWTCEGSNNSLIILGTDRARPDGPAGAEHGLGHIAAPGAGKGTGVVHLIAGRQDMQNGDPDLKRDLSYLYLAMKTNADENIGAASVEVPSSLTPAAVLKSDAVRILFRKDLKMVLDGKDTYIFVNEDKTVISVGSRAKITITPQTGEVTVEGGVVNVRATTVDARATDVRVAAESVSVSSGRIELGDNPEKTVLGESLKRVVERYASTHTHPFMAKSGPDMLVTLPSVDPLDIKLSSKVSSA